MTAPYVIWSNEHRAWWRGGNWGYTPDLAEAGHYPRAEAVAIARRALDGRREGANPNEIALPFADAIDQFGGGGQLNDFSAEAAER